MCIHTISGKIFSKSGIHAPDPYKVVVIQNLEVPKSKKDVGSLLSRLSYYRSYLPTFNDIARPLIEHTKKRAPNEVTWSEQCEKALVDQQIADLLFAVLSKTLHHICRHFITCNRRLSIPQG